LAVGDNEKGDALIFLQGSLWRQPAEGRALKHTLKCGKWNTSAAGTTYVVDNSQAKARGKGIGFHFSKSLKDRDIRTLAHWDTIVSGADQGDGWLLVGDCYLPMLYEGKQVLRPVKRAEQSQHGMQSAAAGHAPQRASKAGAAASFSAGDAVEMWSNKSSTWFACVITGKGILPGTFDVQLPTAPSAYQDTPSVPIQNLRRAPGVANTRSLAEVFAPGAALEFKISTGKSWIHCTVESKGKLPGTYNVHIPGGQAGQGPRRVMDVPAAWLRKPATSVSARPATPASSHDPHDVDAVLQRLHASYAEIKQLLDTEALPAS